MRHCTRCQTDKPEGAFSASHRWCSECKRNSDCSYYARNSERGIEASRKRYREKRAEILAKMSAYYQANKAVRDARTLEYFRKHPEAKAVISHKRRAAMLSSVNTLTRDEWVGVLVSFDHRCAYCGCGDVKITLDHMQPLARGGSHEVNNVVPACVNCNSVKQARGVLSMVNRPWRGVHHQT